MQWADADLFQGNDRAPGKRIDDKSSAESLCEKSGVSGSKSGLKEDD